MDPSWQGVPPARVIDHVAAAGLQLDPTTGIGVVLHMLSCLAIDGRLAFAAIGRTPEQATREEGEPKPPRVAVAAAARQG